MCKPKIQKRNPFQTAVVWTVLFQVDAGSPGMSDHTAVVQGKLRFYWISVSSQKIQHVTTACVVFLETEM